MSRRIEIHRILTRPYPEHPDFLRTDIELVIHGAAGKAALQHDPEMLIMAIADLINGGSHTARAPWVINDRAPGAEIPTAMTVIHDWDRNPGSYARQLESAEKSETIREILFEAVEIVSRGEAIWVAKAKGTHTRSPLGDQHLYHAEMLRAAIEVILYAPAPRWPKGDPLATLFAAAEARRWTYKHEGD